MIKRTISIGAMLAISALVMVAQPSPEEQKGIAAIQAAAPQGADALAAAVDDFVAKFPKSAYRATVLSSAADVYESLGKSDKAQAYYQRTLEADPKNYYAMIMVGTEIVKGTKEFEIDDAARTAKLNKAEKLLKDALSMIALAPKPNPAASDEEWNTLKKDDEARAHEALGMLAMARAIGPSGTKKYDTAISEFKTAATVGASPQPAAMIRLGAAYNDAGRMPEAIVELDKVIAMKDLPAAYKQVAENEKKRSNELIAKAAAAKK